MESEETFVGWFIAHYVRELLIAEERVNQKDLRMIRKGTKKMRVTSLINPEVLRLPTNPTSSAPRNALDVY